MEIETQGVNLIINIVKRQVRGGRYEAWVDVFVDGVQIAGNNIISTRSLLSDDDVFDRAEQQYLDSLVMSEEEPEELE